jgi:hypothetical protein
MTIVRLTSWKPGFVPNRLVALLRSFGLGLAEAHEMATRFVNGGEVSVCFDDRSRADSFSNEAQELGVTAVTNEGIRIAS